MTVPCELGMAPCRLSFSLSYSTRGRFSIKVSRYGEPVGEKGGKVMGWYRGPNPALWTNSPEMLKVLTHPPSYLFLILLPFFCLFLELPPLSSLFHILPPPFYNADPPSLTLIQS